MALGLQNFGMHQRCPFSTTTDSSNNSGHSESNKDSGANSSGEEKAGESNHQSSDAGKSVRGGVVLQSRQFTSFLDLLFY